MNLKVLLKKDFLTLWRNKGFIVTFCVLPIALMSAFTAIQNLVNKGEKSGSLIKEYFRYTSNFPIAPYMDVPPLDLSKNKTYSTTLFVQTLMN